MSIHKTTELTFFYATWCGGCAQLKPIIRRVAELKGWRLKEVDVENCPKDVKCDKIKYVPHIEMDGKEVPLENLEQLLNV